MEKEISTPPTPINFADTQTAFAYKTNGELNSSYWLFKLINNPSLVKVSTTLAQLAFKWHLPVTPLVKHTIYNQFCSGESLQSSLPVIARLNKYGVKSLLDYGVEGLETETDFDKTVQQLLRSIEFARTNPAVPAISTKISGFARFALLEKVSGNITLSTNEQTEWEYVWQRMHQLCKAARDAKISIYFDAEESWIQPAIDLLVNTMMEEYNHGFPFAFTTLQMYRHDRLDFLKQLYADAKSKGFLAAVKLVRGAYMEKERARAKEFGYPSPIQADKAASDRDFNLALQYSIEHIDGVAVCNASHNEDSAAYLCQVMQQNGVTPNHPNVWFAQLYGMGDHISFNLAKAGYNVAKYLPYGPVREVIPYLIRRSQENTSVTGQMSRELGLILQEKKRRKTS